MDAIVVEGIDVSKDRLDVHVVPAREVLQDTNGGAGIDRLADRLGKLAPQFVVLGGNRRL